MNLVLIISREGINILKFKQRTKFFHNFFSYLNFRFLGLVHILNIVQGLPGSSVRINQFNHILTEKPRLKAGLKIATKNQSQPIYHIFICLPFLPPPDSLFSVESCLPFFILRRFCWGMKWSRSIYLDVDLHHTTWVNTYDSTPGCLPYNIFLMNILANSELTKSFVSSGRGSHLK